MEQLVNDNGAEESKRSEYPHPPVCSNGQPGQLIRKNAGCKRPDDQRSDDQPTRIHSNCEAQHFEKSDSSSEHMNLLLIFCLCVQGYLRASIAPKRMKSPAPLG